ncbi:Translation initiation factor IF-3 [Mucisphaera calidilacus]|uniref:Translation initiation factor IF-3 n=2 Tax=Mucisphaera calidilacus TaxID=2527982 RepID=A0A518BUK8_9BACT|nr:Translation initiation factor IF-3 [Mucisphaera calidilacus]
MIRVPQVRLVDENNEQIGIIDTNAAKDRAQDAGLDLVEVSPNSDPPVCRIMDYGKWKYAQKKKESKAKSHASQSELKGIRLRPNIDEHDLGIKLKKARQFLEEGHKVQFTMLFRGRQMAHQGLHLDLMRNISSQLEDVSKIEQIPKMLGRRATMVLAADKSGPKTKKDDTPRPAPAPAASKPAAQPPAPAPNLETASTPNE